MSNETPEVIWTGRNLDDVESFARGHEFGFSVGSPFHNYRWWHRLANRVVPELWEPPEDPTVLEIYPSGPNDRPYHWTTARVGDRIRHGGVVIRDAG